MTRATGREPPSGPVRLTAERVRVIATAPVSPRHGTGQHEMRWLLQRSTATGQLLRVGHLRLPPGRHSTAFWPTWDGFVMDGGAAVARNELEARIAPGDALTLDPGRHVTIDVERQIEILVVCTSSRPKSPSGAVVWPDLAGQTEAYALPNPIRGSPITRVAWARVGPEGTGEFFSGYWECGEVVYEKEFIADEFVLILGGEMEIRGRDPNAEPMRFSVGDIAFFPRGFPCRREVTGDFRQWFAGA